MISPNYPPQYASLSLAKKNGRRKVLTKVRRRGKKTKRGNWKARKG